MGLVCERVTVVEVNKMEGEKQERNGEEGGNRKVQGKLADIAAPDSCLEEFGELLESPGDDEDLHSSSCQH